MHLLNRTEIESLISLFESNSSSQSDYAPLRGMNSQISSRDSHLATQPATPNELECLRSLIEEVG